MAAEIAAQVRAGRNYSLSIRRGDTKQLRPSGTALSWHLQGVRRSETSETGKTTGGTTSQLGVEFLEVFSSDREDVEAGTCRSSAHHLRNKSFVLSHP